MGKMTIEDQMLALLKDLKKQIAILDYGNVDFIIHNGSVIRVDIKTSVKPEKTILG